MTERMHYPDMFKTINSPKPTQDLVLFAHNLFQAVHGERGWEPGVHARLLKSVDTVNASQLFWEFENEEARQYDKLALTAMKSRLTIAVHHRDYADRGPSTIKSLVIEAGHTGVYNSNTLMNTQAEPEYDPIGFREILFETTANLGLQRRVAALRLVQNDTSSAIFANAA